MKTDSLTLVLETWISGNKRVRLFVPLVTWCLLLLTIRIGHAGNTYYKFLAWNLFLAAVPLFAGSLFCRSLFNGSGMLKRAACFCFWLVFFPNSPYVLTDLIHLMPRPPVPLWYDLSMILSFGGTGLLMGYLSLSDVHTAVARKAGPAIGWCVAIGSLLLSGFGLYLGRFVRLNSWDVALKPNGVLSNVATIFLHPGQNLDTVRITFVFGIILALWYVAMHSIASRQLE